MTASIEQRTRSLQYTPAQQAEFLERLIDSSADCIKVLDLDARLISMSPNGQKLLRIMDFESVEGAYWVDFWKGDDRVAARAAVDTALAGGTGRFTGYFPVEDEPRWFDVTVTPIADADGRPERLLSVSRDVTTVRLADDERRRMEDGLRLLARTGAATLESLDARATLQRIVRAAVHDFATFCVVDVLDDGARWQRVALAHRDAQREPALERTRHLSQPVPEHPIARALHDGVSSLVTVDDEWAHRAEREADRIEALYALAARSILTVPVVTPAGEVLGALTCVRDADDARDDYRDGDRSFVEEVGRRAGAAIANARLYERERRIAVELQNASLPAALPRLEGVELDADYRPGSDEATIGGDWYDAFVLPDGRVAITVGDVLGHGLHAAVTMTKLRQAMQSAAMVKPDPNLMLDVADKTLRLIERDGYATALAAIYDASAQTLSIASAGHAGPLARTPDGRIEEYSRPGSMLGLRTGDEHETMVVHVAAGTVLVFFTDGLTEATRDIDEGYRRLHDALACDAVLYADAPAQAIVQHVLGATEATDDIAVLVARIGPANAQR